ncbi:DUF1826 domain-containing protein [Sphingomonas sp. FW199]|uniref:DUF1826 domain-containing protein n=1 Tax=Sphingomonas sp. FW199 TaxID=3400217 RepID=UPI003CF23D6B
MTMNDHRLSGMASVIDRADAVAAATRSLEDLAAVRHPDIALAIHPRSLPPGLADAVDALDLEGIDDTDLIVDLPISGEAFAVALAVSGFPASAARMIGDDMARLAQVLADVADCTRLAIRLHVVETDACRKFHADYVTLRLLTTYRGRATEWHRAETPDRIDRLRPGDVAIFKGRVLIDPPAVLHRSPPIAGTGELRLLLVIDPAPLPGG